MRLAAYTWDMDNQTKVYVLVTLSIAKNGEVQRKNVGVTFSIHDAEAHQGQDISNEYETHAVDANWQEAAATSALVDTMRIFKDMVAEQHAEALR